MPRIELNRITPGITELNRRFLRYEVVRTNDSWRQLRITLPVRYRWAFEYAGLWTEPRKTAFKQRFRRNIDATWSRRFRLTNDSSLSVVRVEVIVTIDERVRATSDELWHVLVYPEGAVGDGDVASVVPAGFDEPIERIVCSYHYRGYPHDIPRPIHGAEELRDVGACFLREDSVRCTPTPGNRRYTQRGGDHEVGHMLGTQHPGGICSEHACYGTTNAQRNRIMGAGHQVTAADYAFALAIMHQDSNARVGQRIWRLEADGRTAGVSTCT